ncbi:MAG: SDR family NAD(P)-dependent oxidoreductase, partial [Candidatus Viridilinea halotolerans]
RFAARLVPWQHQGEQVTMSLDPQASYLITGGVGALGLQTAQQLVADGARRLVLSSRRTELSAAQQQAVMELEAAGATVAVVGADVGEADAVQRLLAHCNALGPLRGIVHAAGMIDDGVLAAQTPTRLAGVMRPKAEGAWHLHRLTTGYELDFFIGFSSLASAIGSSGQSNYAAANGFLDGLLHARRAQGLTGQSINWGPWSAIGLAAHLTATMQRQGIGMISPAQGRAIFCYLMRQATAHVAVLPLNPAPPAPLVPTAPLRNELVQLPDAERLSHLIRWLQREVSRVLLLDRPERVELEQPLFDMGMDSLMAVDLRRILSVDLKLSLHATLIFEYPTIRSLASWLLGQLRLSLGETNEATENPPDVRVMAQPEAFVLPEAIDDATDAELLAFIDQEFGEVL